MIKIAKTVKISMRVNPALVFFVINIIYRPRETNSTVLFTGPGGLDHLGISIFYIHDFFGNLLFFDKALRLIRPLSCVFL